MNTLLHTQLISESQIFRLRRKIYHALISVTKDKNSAALFSSSFSSVARYLVIKSEKLSLSINVQILDMSVSLRIMFISEVQDHDLNKSIFQSEGYSCENKGSFLLVEKYISLSQEILSTNAVSDATKILLDKTTEELLNELNLQNSKLEKEVEERKKAEENLKETQKDLIINEKLAALGSMVAGVAHEINTPVGISVTAASHLKDSIESFISMYEQNKIKKSDLDILIRTVRESNAVVEENLQRASKLIRSFKEVAVDQSAEDEREIFFKQYVEQIITSLSPRFRNRAIEIVTDDIDPSLKVTITPGPIAQILSNLIENSLVHAFDENQKGLIRIAATLDGEGLQIVYSDNGKGIPEEYLQKIFDPFFTTKRSEGGTGLGMHLVHNIVRKKFAGQIRCESEVNKGTTFYISLNILK